MGSTQALVAIARGIRAEALPANVLSVAKHCLLDWLGVTLAGAREPMLRILSDQVRGADTARAVSLFGLGDRCTLLDAALLQGTAAHALDYDDTLVLVGHFSTTQSWDLRAEVSRAARACLLSGLDTEIKALYQRGMQGSHQEHAFASRALNQVGG